jgi:hypothetical protein
LFLLKRIFVLSARTLLVTGAGYIRSMYSKKLKSNLVNVALVGLVVEHLPLLVGVLVHLSTG